MTGLKLCHSKLRMRTGVKVYQAVFQVWEIKLASEEDTYVLKTIHKIKQANLPVMGSKKRSCCDNTTQSSNYTIPSFKYELFLTYSSVLSHPSLQLLIWE